MDATTPDAPKVSTIPQGFIFSTGDIVTGINPMVNTTGPDNGFHALILESLVLEVPTEGGGAAIVPGIAETWDVSSDGLVYTFHMRDALWSDGEKVTADDFLFTFQTMANPVTGSTNAWLFDNVIVNFSESLYNDGVDPEKNKLPTDIGVKALDEKTVEFTLVKPYGYFLDLLSGAMPVRRDKYEEYGDLYGSSIEKSLGNGPFVMDSWDQNIEIKLSKNETYWDAEHVHLDKITRLILSEESTRVQALLSGQIDVATTKDPDWKSMIEADGSFKEIITPLASPEFFAFNAKNEYFKHPKIRMAFAIAYDREKFVNDLREGVDTPIYSMIPPVISVGDTLYHERVNNENDIVKELQVTYTDPKALLIEGLTEAGFDPDPSKMKVRLASRGTAELSKKIAEWMLQTWQENLGVTVEIDMMEWNIMWDKEASPPIFKGLSYMYSHGYAYHYSVADTGANLSDILAEISRETGILDLEIKNPPLETIVANLYEQL